MEESMTGDGGQVLRGRLMIVTMSVHPSGAITLHAEPQPIAGDQLGPIMMFGREPQETGLSVADIQKLKSHTASEQNMEEAEYCTICQGGVCPGQQVLDLNCKHSFCRECLEPWLSKKNSCPLCRAPAIEMETPRVERSMNSLFASLLGSLLASQINASLRPQSQVPGTQDVNNSENPSFPSAQPDVGLEQQDSGQAAEPMEVEDSPPSVEDSPPSVEDSPPTVEDSHDSFANGAQPQPATVDQTDTSIALQPNDILVASEQSVGGTELAAPGLFPDEHGQTPGASALGAPAARARGHSLYSFARLIGRGFTPAH